LYFHISVSIETGTYVCLNRTDEERKEAQSLHIANNNPPILSEMFSWLLKGGKMFEARKAKLEELKNQFEEESNAHSAHLRQTGEQYLRELGLLLREYLDGSASDPKLTGIDTTGSLRRAEDDARWAMEEQQRVRKVLAKLV
jgi:hypothetical protein